MYFICIDCGLKCGSDRLLYCAIKVHFDKCCICGYLKDVVDVNYFDGIDDELLDD